MKVADVLDLLKTNLETYFAVPGNAPPRIVSRELVDFAQRPDADLASGVVSYAGLVLGDLDTQRDLLDVAGRLQIVMLGQFKLSEAATGLEVEHAEQALWEQIKKFCQAPGAGLCPLTPMRVEFSGQQYKPYGVIAVDLIYQEID